MCIARYKNIFQKMKNNGCFFIVKYKYFITFAT